MSAEYGTSESIVSGIKKGDRLAEEALVLKYGTALQYVLERRTGDSDKARDLQQDTFVIVLQKLRSDSLNDPSKLGAYIQKTAINLHIGDVRKEVRRGTFTNSELIDSQVDGEGNQYQALVQYRARYAVGRLIAELHNDRDKKILTLFYIEDLDKELVCEKLKLSYRHFDRVISRARLRFKELVESRQDEIPIELSE